MPKEFGADTLIFSDLHMEEKRQTYKKVFSLIEGWSKDKGNKGTVIFNGDLTDVGNKVPNRLIKDARQFFSKLEANGTDVHITLGNHDYHGFKSNYVPVILAEDVTAFSPKLHIADTLVTLKGGKRALFLPYKREEKELREAFQKVYEMAEKPNYVFFHNDIPGAQYPNGKRVKTDNPIVLCGNVMYFGGHIHKHQVLHSNKVVYVGSPYQVNFGEVGEEKGIIFLNSKTEQWKLFPVPGVPEFASVNLGLVWSTLMQNQANTDELKSKVVKNHVRVIGEIDYESWKAMDREKAISTIKEMGALSCVFQLDIKRERRRTLTMDTAAVSDADIMKEFVSQSETEMDKAELTHIGTEIWESAK